MAQAKQSAGATCAVLVLALAAVAVVTGADMPQGKPKGTSLRNRVAREAAGGKGAATADRKSRGSSDCQAGVALC